MNKKSLHAQLARHEGFFILRMVLFFLSVCQFLERQTSEVLVTNSSWISFLKIEIGKTSNSNESNKTNYSSND